MSTAAPLTVALAERSYPIHIGSGLLADTALLRGSLAARKVAIVSNTAVAPLYAAALHAARQGQGETLDIVLPDGEAHKNLDTLTRIFDVLVANRFARDDLLVALGGGVVGDITGFAAACYQRGIDFVQIPTTLLAQVDSSVGGKTAVNHPGGKNLVGAFHQPIAVIADTDTLRTLPPRELRAGLAEVIKYGLICDAEFFDWLEWHVDALLALDAEMLGTAIRRCCEIKADIVARDEREQGERALLNLGHTFGHAIETVTGYSAWLHGEAVGVGLAMACSLSQRAGWMTTHEVQRVTDLLQRVGLRTEARGEVPPEAARVVMAQDKKVKAGQLRLVLMRGIGAAFVTADYPPEALEATLRAHLS